MPTAPKLGLIIPSNWADGGPPAQELISFFQRADELGFDSLWVIDRLFHQYGMPHPMTMLTYAAAVTQRIGLGTGVVLLSVRHPVDLAQQAATLNALSGERLTLGVSQGGRPNEFQGMSMPIEQRTGRLVEGVSVMRRLWTESDVTFHGRYYHLEGANISPKPTRPGGIPVVWGASNEASLRRAGRLSDGWMQGARGTPESYAQAWATVQQAARDAGRDPATLHSSKLLYTNPDSDKNRAARELQHYLSFYYGPNYPMEHTAVGSANDIASKVRDLGDAGCETVILGLPGPHLAKLESLATEVMPLMG
jgi:probable F420-dependent oxidoreductase